MGLGMSSSLKHSHPVFNKIFNLKLMINLLWLQYADVREISAALLRFIRDEFETLKLPN
jgi:hypothetical protein